MLRPQDNGVREAKRVDGIWSLQPDAAGTGRAHGWWNAPLRDPRAVPVPSSYNDLYLGDDLHDHVGDVWYQTVVTVPKGWVGHLISLRFDAATHRAVVWVDDTEVTRHEGGYLPFEADITAYVTPGTEARITVVVNNELTWESIPPGVIQTLADGTRRQRYYHDFFNYAGLHRSVWLTASSPCRIVDLTVTTAVDGTDGVVRYTASIDGTTPAATVTRVALTDACGAVVDTTEGDTGTLRITNVELWRPGRGYLYQLTVEVVDVHGTVVDRYRQSVGVRTVEIDGTRFLINGEPFYFRGFGMHEDLAIRGKGHDPAAMIHDFELLGWIGANSLRTSHYPYAEEVLDHADRLGIVVIDEAPAVGLNLGIGGGFFLGGQYTTYSPDTITNVTREVHRQAIVELIDRDKNHPSVVMWCIANEPESQTDAAVEYFAPLFQTARALDPTRPVGFVNMLLATVDQCKLTDLADVVMLNRYYGWYIEPGDIGAAEQLLETELNRWAERHAKPILITEYGADTVAGVHMTRPSLFSEEYQADLLDMHHRVFDRVDAVVGEHVWVFADFMTTASFMRVDGNKKGVFTRDRRPKMAAHHLRRRWRNDPT